MVLRWWYGIALNLLLAVLLVSGAAIAAAVVRGKQSPPQLLVLGDAVSGKVYGSWPLADGGEFAIEFIHSVNQSPVRETFKRDGKIFRPVETRFSSFGAGMQTEPGEGEVMSRDGDFLIITGFTRSFDELNYIVGTVSDHVLYINGGELSLRDLCGKNAHVNIHIK
ncbi:hypothetical protein AGMMS49928_05410 [Spirochaetia bacterium]|nr:hypothetical protein AGMMS49928_05410 [Spirochaetia bacterium]